MAVFRLYIFYQYFYQLYLYEVSVTQGDSFYLRLAIGSRKAG